MEFQERVNRIHNDEDFRKHCFLCLEQNKNFEEQFQIAKQIAFIDTKGIEVDKNLLYPNQSLSKDEIEKYVLGFFKFLDRLAPDEFSFENTVQRNKQYLTFDNHGDKNARSYCSVRNGKKEIFCNMEGRVGDLPNIIHELCHSLSKAFTESKPRKDIKTAEITTVITDQLSNYFLSKKIPSLSKNFNANRVFIQIQNVKKARETLLDGLVIKLMTNQTTMEKIQKEYGELINNNFDLVNKCLDQIEHIDFQNMFEGKYLVPQAIALEMLDKFTKNPEEVAKQFKELLKIDTELTEAETLERLRLPNKHELIEQYVKKFPNRTKEMLKCISENEFAL